MSLSSFPKSVVQNAQIWFAIKPPPAFKSLADPQKPVSPWLVYVLAMMFWVKLYYSNLRDVWTSGQFADTDDAMQLVEMRNWMAGQGWFDMTVTRMDPPIGVAMHWSRLYDAALALCVRAFQLFTDGETAERLMRLFVPAAMFTLVLVVMIRISRRYIGADSALFAALLTALSTAICFFAPGAISHHGIQAVMLVAMVSLTLDSIGDSSLRSAVGAGGLAALSLQISLETLPFVGVMIALFSLNCAWIGAAFARKLTAFAVSFALAAAAVGVATIRPEQYLHLTYDAFSLAHVGAAWIGGLGLILFARSGAGLHYVQSRLAALALCGGVSALMIVWIFPDFLRDPLFEVAPLVRKEWLSHVAEGQSLWQLNFNEPETYVPMSISMAMSMIAMLLAVWRETGQRRLVWASVAAFGVMGVIGSLWQIRVAPLATPIFILGAVWAISTSLSWSKSRSGRWVKLLPLVVILPFLNTLWTFVLPASAAPPSDIPGKSESCFSASAFQAFKTLPKGLILNLIDSGPNLLAFTDHSVVSGPYHRDNRGLSLLIQTWESTPEKAETFVRESGATYLAYCPPAYEFKGYAKDKASLAAHLYAGDIPSWLSEVRVADTPFKVFAVK